MPRKLAKKIFFVRVAQLLCYSFNFSLGVSILTKTLISLQSNLKSLYSLDLMGNPVCDLENYQEEVFKMIPSLDVSLWRAF